MGPDMLHTSWILKLVATALAGKVGSEKGRLDHQTRRIAATGRVRQGSREEELFLATLIIRPAGRGAACISARCAGAAIGWECYWKRLYSYSTV